jgi:hypothetical protein
LDQTVDRNRLRIARNDLALAVHAGQGRICVVRPKGFEPQPSDP